MHKLSTWWQMGGYAFYIWTAYGLVFFILFGNILRLKWQKVLFKRKLSKWFKWYKANES